VVVNILGTSFGKGASYIFTPDLWAYPTHSTYQYRRYVLVLLALILLLKYISKSVFWIGVLFWLQGTCFDLEMHAADSRGELHLVTFGVTWVSGTRASCVRSSAARAHTFFFRTLSRVLFFLCSNHLPRVHILMLHQPFLPISFMQQFALPWENINVFEHVRYLVCGVFTFSGKRKLIRLYFR